MNYEFEKAFVKDFRKLKNKELASAIHEVIKQVSEASSPNQIINLKSFQDINRPFEFESVIIGLG